MKAVILAGGEGKRLRSVSGDVPKPMVSVLGKPILEHIVELLKKHGFDDICMAVHYRHEQIEECFGDGSRMGVKIQYRVEDEPLGTAGAVKNCEDFYGKEDFLVISGDAACDIDLKALYSSHKKNGSCATVALYRSSSPTSYGLAVTDSFGIVRSFIEKPDWSRVVTDLVNTGIYILSPGAMKYVPPHESCDFAKDLFPRLMDSGETIYARTVDGYWKDIGQPESYFQCCLDAINGIYKIDPAPEFLPKKQEDGEDGEGDEYECADRASLMGALSQVLLDMGADFSDGIRLRRPHYEMHIFPCMQKSAVRVHVDSNDAEFAKQLSVTAGELIRTLENNQRNTH